MFRARDINKAVEIKMYKTEVKPMFGSETWAVTDEYEKTGYLREEKKDTWTGNKAWNMEKRTDQKLREIYKDLDIVADIERRD
jgi:hypothetical protein